MKMETSEPRSTEIGGDRACAQNDDFRSALARLLAAGRMTSTRGAFAMLLCAALGAFAALLAAEAPLGGWRYFPLFSFALFWGVLAAAAGAAAVRQFYPPRGDRWLAGELDRRLGGGNLVEAALEFSKGSERVSAYSSFLVAATVRRARERLRGLEPREVFAAAGRPAWTAAGIVLGVLAALEIAVFGGDPVGIVSSIADPGRSFRFPYRYNLVVTSGDRSVLPGETVTVEAINYGSMRGDATLRVSTIPGVWNGIGVRGAKLPGEGAQWFVYRHEFVDVREDFTYSFSAGGVRTAAHRVTVIHRPVINGMTAILKYPPYTGAKADTLEPLAGRIVALAGTRVELEGRTSKPVRDGRLRFASGSSTPLEPAPGGFAAAFTIVANDTFVVETVDSLGFTNDHTVKYPIAALDDAPPSIEIVAPDDGAELPRTLVADLYYRGSDDYGIARVRLFSMRDGKDEDFTAAPVAIPAGPLTEIEGRFAWSLENAGVFPGDKILYYLEITDNNTATGPRTARTATRRILVPSISEIYARIREEESRRREDLEDVLGKGREIRERMKKLSDELKAEGNLDWSRRRESGEILQKQKEIQSAMREITGEIDKSLETLEKNRAASQEVGQKIEEIQKLLKRIENDDLRSAIEKLQKMMNDVPAGELAAAMNEIELDTEKLVESMDRTIELLKQVIKEEKMDEFVRRMEEMLKEQVAIRDSTAQGETKDLAERQEELGEEAEDYEKKLGEFAKEESDSSLASELDSILKEMEQSKPEEDMKRAAEQMSREDREGAQRSQKDAIDEMLSLFTSLSSCQMSMGLTMEKEVAAMIARSTRELIEASKLQESVVPKLLGQGGRSSAGDLIDEELVVKTALQKISQNLYQAARKTMALSPKIFIRLGLAQKEIDTALGTMEEGRSLEASEASARAYRAMNLAAIELLRANVSQGGAGGSGRERMQQLLKQQLSLKQELQRLLERGRAGQWSMEERAGMARIAAEQRKMEEVMRQIAEESRGARDALGKLDDIAGSMEEVARDLDEGKLDRELVDRQERILTRMLESQRSLRERDYKKERSSTAAGDVDALAPEKWREEMGDEEILLRMIRRAMQERGPKEYEELIREYFRALSEKVREPK
jgi:hypothetical protein